MGNIALPEKTVSSRQTRGGPRGEDGEMPVVYRVRDRCRLAGWHNHGGRQAPRKPVHMCCD